MKPRGFTLIELLVVIAIIAVLAAIIFPAFAQAKQKAYQASCESNLKNLTIAFLMYADDNDGDFPCAYPWSTVYDWGNWATKILPYVGNNVAIFKCPSDTREPYPDYASYPYGKDSSSYAYNQWLAGEMGYSEPGIFFGVPVAEVVQPSKTILVHDTAYPEPCTTTLAYPVTSTCFFSAYTTHSYRHNGGDNFAFVDGHVKWYRISMNVNAPDQYTDPEHDISFDFTYDK